MFAFHFPTFAFRKGKKNFFWSNCYLRVEILLSWTTNKSKVYGKEKLYLSLKKLGNNKKNKKSILPVLDILMIPTCKTSITQPPHMLILSGVLGTEFGWQIWKVFWSLKCPLELTSRFIQRPVNILSTTYSSRGKKLLRKKKLGLKVSLKHSCSKNHFGSGRKEISNWVKSTLRSRVCL